MPYKLSKLELIERVGRLQSGLWNETEMERLFQEIGENVPCAQADIQGFIFHAKDNPSAAAIVERMLACKPIEL